VIDFADLIGILDFLESDEEPEGARLSAELLEEAEEDSDD